MNLDTIALADFAGGGEIPVPCDKIHAKLDEIWRGIALRAQRQAAARPGDGAPRARIAVHRACLLNLVIHAGDRPSEVVARFLTGTLADKLPTRVILLRSRPEEDAPPGSPRAFVSAAVNPVSEGQGSRVAGETIVLEARGRELDRVPAVVRAVLEPDLATTLWWTGPLPPPRPWVAQLRDMADRVVVDSEAIPDDAESAHVLPPAGSGRVADLTWPRLAPWRLALARAFDEPANRAFLASVDAVRIGLGAPQGTIPDASAGPLLAGWLGAALGWQGCARRGDREVAFEASSARRPARAVSVSIVPRPSPFRGVVDVELSAGSQTLRVRRTREGTVACDVPPGFAAVRPAPFREADPMEVLASALLEIHADPIAPDAIRRAAEMAAAMCPRRAG